MTVQLELSPEVEAGLSAQAQAYGLSLEEFARQALEERAAGVQAARVSTEERLRAFEEFVTGFESPAVVPEEAFQRENWYPDR